MKKIISLILALVMVMALAVTASAAETTGSITITPPAGVEDTTYNIYKVFDAVGDGTNIRYTVMSGKSGVPTGFSVDTAGNVSYSGTGDELTEADINAIKAYVDGDTPVATASVTGGAAVTVSGLANGYYYIATNSGAVVAINSTNPNASVTDKNQVPTLEKKILVGGVEVDSTSASIGDIITFHINVSIPEGASGELVVHDKMDSALMYVPNEGTDFGDFSVETGSLVADGCTLHFKLNDVTNYAGKEYTLTYRASLLNSAETDTPIPNEAWLSYGDYTYPHDTVEVITYQLDVEKVDGNDEPLPGAKFKLMDKDTGKYYTEGTGGYVSWTDAGTEVEAVLVDGKYVANFKGLGNGTYTLEESTVPAGYNKAADQDIPIEGASKTGENAIKVENLSGSTLPSTGGMGTTLFYVIGGLMMTCAVVVLVTKRRVA